MRKTLNAKIDDISDYVNTASKKNNKHKEFIRLVELHKNSTLSKADLDKLRMITDFFIAEKRQKSQDKKLKQIERKERKKAKSDERRNYERQCFLLGGALLKLKIENTDIPKFILILCEMYAKGLISDDNLKEFKEFNFKIAKENPFMAINKSNYNLVFENNKNNKNHEYFFGFSLKFIFENKHYMIAPFVIKYSPSNKEFYMISIIYKIGNNEDLWKAIFFHENNWHLELGLTDE